jgi:hypothetical protein
MGRRGIGLVCMLCGAAAMVTGAVLGIIEIGEMYEGVAADPLAEPDTSEEDRASDVLRYAVVGGAGVVPFAIGTALLRSGSRRRRGRS